MTILILTETNNSTTRAVRPIPAGWPRGPRDPAVPCPVSVAYSGCHGHGVDTPGRRTHGHGQLDSAGRFNHDFRFSVSRYHSRGPAGPGTSLRLSAGPARPLGACLAPRRRWHRHRDGHWHGGLIYNRDRDGDGHRDSDGGASSLSGRTQASICPETSQLNGGTSYLRLKWWDGHPTQP